MSILKAITKKLAEKIVDKKISSLKENLEKDSKVEEFDKITQDLKDNRNEYDDRMKIFCKMHPDHPLCQKRDAPRYKK